MEVLGWCKWCGSPITEDDFEEGETRFGLENELISTQIYICPSCNTEMYNTIVYKLVEKENIWRGLSKADPNYGIWEEDKEE